MMEDKEEVTKDGKVKIRIKKDRRRSRMSEVKERKDE